MEIYGQLNEQDACELLFSQKEHKNTVLHASIVGRLQSVDRRKDENLTKKTCHEKFKSVPVAKMKNIARGFCVKSFSYSYILFVGEH